MIPLSKLINIIDNAYSNVNPGWTPEEYKKFIAQIQKWYSKKYKG